MQQTVVGIRIRLGTLGGTRTFHVLFLIQETVLIKGTIALEIRGRDYK